MHRPVVVLIPLLLACNASEDSDDSSGPPVCTFSGTFSGGVRGELHLVEEGCSSGGNPGYVGGKVTDEGWEISTLLDDSLILTEGATFTDVPAQVILKNLDDGNIWSNHTGDCLAQVTGVTAHTDVWQTLVVSGTLSCDPLSASGDNIPVEDATLVTGAFSYQVL